GVAGYVSKPVSFLGLVDVMRGIGDYWFEIVRLPGGK
ncbi:MAG: response regulator, partial [Acidimicrobiia bacterium]|nr:response regulator [Acidimicrobiia bacterium]